MKLRIPPSSSAASGTRARDRGSPSMPARCRAVRARANHRVARRRRRSSRCRDSESSRAQVLHDADVVDERPHMVGSQAHELKVCDANRRRRRGARPRASRRTGSRLGDRRPRQRRADPSRFRACRGKVLEARRRSRRRHRPARQRRPNGTTVPAHRTRACLAPSSTASRRCRSRPRSARPERRSARSCVRVTKTSVAARSRRAR